MTDAQLEHFFSVIERQFSTSSSSFAVRQHQKAAVRKAITNARAKLGLCLTLGLGLGKTLVGVMILAYFIMAAREKQRQRSESEAKRRIEHPDISPVEKQQHSPRALIITPATSIRSVWLASLHPIFGEDEVFVYQGPHRDHANQRDRLMNAAVIITTYEMILSHDKREATDSGFDLFSTYQWSAIVMDEIQELKNGAVTTKKQSKKARAVYRLVDQQRHCFAMGLTGTLVGNHILEIASIMRALNPHSEYGERKFWVQAATSSTTLQSYLRKLSFHAIRDECKDMVPLPAKTEFCVLTPFSDLQIAHSHRVFEEGREQIELYADADHKDRGSIQLHVFHLLDKLRKLCSTAYYGVGPSCKYKTPLSTLSSSQLLANCSKLVPTLDIVTAALTKQESVVIFVQWHYTMDTVEKVLHEVFPEQEILRFTGELTPDERAERVDTFQRAEPQHRIMIMLLKAGSVSISLTAANHVILYDPWWNCATERQAIGRVWREGQTRPVGVYRLVADGKCVDAIIRNRQRFKATEVINVVFPEQSGSDYAWQGDESKFDEICLFFMQTSMTVNDYRRTCLSRDGKYKKIELEEEIPLPSLARLKRKAESVVQSPVTPVSNVQTKKTCTAVAPKPKKPKFSLKQIRQQVRRGR